CGKKGLGGYRHIPPAASWRFRGGEAVVLACPHPAHLLESPWNERQLPGSAMLLRGLGADYRKDAKLPEPRGIRRYLQPASWPGRSHGVPRLRCSTLFQSNQSPYRCCPIHRAGEAPFSQGAARTRKHRYNCRTRRAPLLEAFHVLLAM